MENPQFDSVIALVEILLKAESINTRLEAAGQILSYEAPEAAIAAAKDFLSKVCNNKNLSDELRLCAIKMLRKSEARKITKPPVQPIEDLAGRLERARQRLADRGLGEGS
jgi:hypothetical protein